ncbi:hypothetical protein VN97_g1361 [Penicillium thymicola]|uniref:Uncharacterized protein n=1 Tax=Penicillium thymicola TaxID=293382 RepID=A0AAI9XC53_PENTH|nr:hypothetical protein VN97_g1361 [Penicillium thymicola]
MGIIQQRKERRKIKPRNTSEVTSGNAVSDLAVISSVNFQATWILSVKCGVDNIHSLRHYPTHAVQP